MWVQNGVATFYYHGGDIHQIGFHNADWTNYKYEPRSTLGYTFLLVDRAILLQQESNLSLLYPQFSQNTYPTRQHFKKNLRRFFQYLHVTAHANEAVLVPPTVFLLLHILHILYITTELNILTLDITTFKILLHKEGQFSNIYLHSYHSRTLTNLSQEMLFKVTLKIQDFIDFKYGGVCHLDPRDQFIMQQISSYTLKCS